MSEENTEKMVSVHLVKAYSYAADGNNVVTAEPGDAELPARFAAKAKANGFTGERSNKASGPSHNKGK